MPGSAWLKRRKPGLKMLLSIKSCF